MRRNASKTAQEQKVKDALIAVRFEPVRARRIDHLSKAPQPGQFCSESRLGSKKADIVAGLWDLRTMGVFDKCKVSNSAVNSIKRLNHDAVARKMWHDDFGNQVVPVAVLSGVYDLANLQLAQSSGIFLFWAHDLEKLTSWIEQHRIVRRSSTSLPQPSQTHGAVRPRRCASAIQRGWVRSGMKSCMWMRAHIRPLRSSRPRSSASRAASWSPRVTWTVARSMEGT